ncbi:MAG: DUF6923 family protein, partial [Cellulosilyticaceae bacterium]
MYATIKGIVFHDARHTGSYSPDFSGIAGIAILLQLPTHEYLTTTTNAHGEFIFKDLYLPGDYILFETVTPQKNLENVSSSLPGPFGYNSMTTPRQYTLSLSAEQIHTDLVYDSFYFGHDFLDPFDATPLAYQVDPEGSHLYSLNLVTGIASLITKLKQSGDYGVMSYNHLDHLIYGYTHKTHQIFKISPSGRITFYTVSHLPQKRFTSSAINDEGELYLYESQDLDFYVVNVCSDSLLYMQLIGSHTHSTHSPYELGLPITPIAIQSWAFHPINHLLYAINTDGCVLCINPTNGTHKLLMTTGTPLSPNKTITFDYTGNLYCVFEGSKALYRIILTDTKATAEVFTTLSMPHLIGGAKSSNIPLYIQLGSAPDLSQANTSGNYSTSLANNGPRHALTNILNFGDTTTEVFELEAPPLLITDTTYTLALPIINRTGKEAYLYGWLDLNQDGTFGGDEACDPLIIPHQLSSPYHAVLTFTRSPSAPIRIGQTYCRLRLTTDLLCNTNHDSTSLDTRSLGPAGDGSVLDVAFN